MSIFSSAADRLANKGKSKVSSMTGMNIDGKLEKIKITGYQDADHNTKIGSEFSVQLNPQSVTISGGIVYKPDAKGGAGVNKTPDVASIKDEHLSLDIMLDGTGATGEQVDVNEKIEALKKICYYVVEKDRPYVYIHWGKTLDFNGRLESLTINYLLFDSKGNPLRAKLSVQFIGLNKQSSDTSSAAGDVTKETDVKEGDTLSNICNKIYNSPATYIAVAKANKLSNVRSLKPGQKLTFPPQKSAEAK